MISSIKIDNKGKDILILGKGPTQGLGEHSLSAEKMYSINFTKVNWVGFRCPHQFYSLLKKYCFEQNSIFFYKDKPNQLNGEGFWGLQRLNRQIYVYLSICVFQYYCLSISAFIWILTGVFKLLGNYSVHRRIHFFILRLILGMPLTISLVLIYQKWIDFIWNLVALRNMSHFRLHAIKRKLEWLYQRSIFNLIINCFQVITLFSNNLFSAQQELCNGAPY